MKLNVIGVKGCVAVVKLVSALIGLAFSGAIGAVVGVVIGWAIEEIASEIGEHYMKKIESEETEEKSKKQNRYNGHNNSHKGFFESENWNVSKNLRGSKKRSFLFYIIGNPDKVDLVKRSFPILCIKAPILIAILNFRKFAKEND